MTGLSAGAAVEAGTGHPRAGFGGIPAGSGRAPVTAPRFTAAGGGGASASGATARTAGLVGAGPLARVGEPAGAGPGGFAAADVGPDLDRLLRPLFRAAAPGGGTAVVVIRGDERAVTCRGRTARSAERPVRADTRFEIGSVTKTFTGLLLAEMAARGEVRYDDPIDRYLPADTAPGYPHERPITLLHLATHTSGLPRLPVGLVPSAAPHWFSDPYATFGPAHLLRALPRTPVRGTPGTQVRYSSLGCGLLGLLLANAAGQRYEELLASRVCGPLGLVDTSCSPGTEEGAGYRRGRRVPSFRLPALPGAAALRSTADDMLRYLQAHLALDAVPLPERADAVALRTALGEVRTPRVAHRRNGLRFCLGWHQRSVPLGGPLGGPGRSAVSGLSGLSGLPGEPGLSGEWDGPEEWGGPEEPDAARRPDGPAGYGGAPGGSGVLGEPGRSGARPPRAGGEVRDGADAGPEAALDADADIEGLPGDELLYHAGVTRGATAFVGFSHRAQVGIAVMTGALPQHSRGFVQAAFDTLRTLAAQRPPAG